MSGSKSWMRYVGLPYRMGADPQRSNATDCIRLVLQVLADAGLNPPAVERQWYRWLAQRDFKAIEADWYRLTEQVPGPEDFAMTLLPTEGDFSIAVVVDNGLLTVKATVGVVWVPLSSMRPLNYRRLKHA